MKKTIQKLIFSLLCVLFGVFAVLSLAKAVTHIMVPQGGTGVGSFTAGECLVGNGTGAVTTQACGGGGGAGGAGVWATNTADTLIYPTPIDYIVLIGTTSTSSSADLEVEGSIQTNDTFYGDNWTSSTGNSMSMKPSGDEDNYISFKTVSNRPTVRIEGGKYRYFESSNVNDVGLSFRKDADHSGTVNYYKDENLFGLTSKDPLVFKANEDYDDYIKIQTANNIPELSVASSAAFKINAGGTNDLLFNHSGGNVGIGITNPSYLLDVNGNVNIPTGSTYKINGVNVVNQDITNGSSPTFLTPTISGLVWDGVTLASTTDINVLGTITTGVWNGTSLTDTYIDNNITITNLSGTNTGDQDLSSYMQDSDINTFSELQAWVTDGTLLKAGTLTDTQYCVWDSASSQIVCDSTPGGSGDITDVFDCATGNCNTMTVGTSEYLVYGSGYIDANRFAGVTTVNATEFGYLNGLTASIVQSGSASHDGFSDYVANEHIDWTGDQGATNIHAGNYTDTNTNANTICSGGTTYMDGEGNCDDISSVYQGTLTNSAGLLSALSDETGTGVAVFGTSPTFTTGVNLPAGSIDTATEISADIITHTQIADSDQADTKCLYFEDPTAADDFKSIWRNSTANNFLITEIWGESDQTVSFDLQVDDGTPADVSGTDIAPAAGEAEDTSLVGDTTLAVSEELDLIITSVSGTPTWVSICWTGNWVD